MNSAHPTSSGKTRLPECWGGAGSGWGEADAAEGGKAGM